MTQHFFPALSSDKDPLKYSLSTEYFEQANQKFHELEQNFNQREGLFSFKNSINYKVFLSYAGLFVFANTMLLLFLFINQGASLLLALYLMFVLIVIMVFISVVMLWVFMDKTAYNHAERKRFFKRKANYEMAKQQQWHYAQQVPAERQTAIINKYKSFLGALSEKKVEKRSTASSRQLSRLKNEVWGYQEHSGTGLTFYKADFSIFIKNRPQEHKLLLAFKIAVALDEKITLVSEPSINLHQDAVFASQQFNQTFRVVDYQPENEDYLLKLYQVLTPAVQEFLLGFKAQNPESVFMFEQGWLYIVFDEPLDLQRGSSVSFLEQSFTSKNFSKSFISLLNDFSPLIRYLS